MNRFQSSLRGALPDSPDTGTGFLIVRVSTARGAIPLEDVVVHVRSRLQDPDEAGTPPVGEEGGFLVASLRTDRSGLTPRLALPAPPRSESERPGSRRPSALYDLDVSLPGYKRQYYQALPIFDTITSLQSVELVPLSDAEGGATDFDASSRFYER